MKLSRKQITDLETVKFFIPKCFKENGIIITDKDIEDFFAYSDRGELRAEIGDYIMNGFNALIQGKIWRGIHMDLWEQGVLDGTTPYSVLLGAEDKTEILPRSVVDFMKKEMFQGIDSDNIDRTYNSILTQEQMNITRKHVEALIDLLADKTLS